MLAMSAANLANRAPAEEAQALRSEARAAATRARRLDRDNAEPYLVEAALMPRRDLLARQRAIEGVIALNPDFAGAHAALARFYMDVGRSEDVLEPMQRAAAIEPLNPQYWAGMTIALSGRGRVQEAADVRERLYRVWPDSAEAWTHRFFYSAFIADPGVALRMLETMDAAPVRFEPQHVGLWRAFLRARQSGNVTRLRAAARAMRGRFPPDGVTAALAVAGDVDTAFIEAQAMLETQGVTYVLWVPPLAPLRRDPRFYELVRGTGLIEYWRESGAWPSFCTEPGLAYDCQSQAARVLR